MQNQQQLIERKAELEHMMMCLEYGDDALFSNANGNLENYKAMRSEASEISKQLAGAA